MALPKDQDLGLHIFFGSNEIPLNQILKGFLNKRVSPVRPSSISLNVHIFL